MTRVLAAGWMLPGMEYWGRNWAKLVPKAAGSWPPWKPLGNCWLAGISPWWPLAEVTSRDKMLRSDICSLCNNKQSTLVQLSMFHDIKTSYLGHGRDSSQAGGQSRYIGLHVGQELLKLVENLKITLSRDCHVTNSDTGHVTLWSTALAGLLPAKLSLERCWWLSARHSTSANLGKNALTCKIDNYFCHRTLTWS